MKMFISILCLVFICCVDFRSAAERKTEEDAKNFYEQVCQLVYSTSAGHFTTGWQQIETNYKSGKRILFLSANSDFSIVVVRNADGEVTKHDSSSATTSEPIDTAKATETAVNVLDKSLKNIQSIANKFQENKFGK